MNTLPDEDQDLAQELRAHYEEELGTSPSSTIFWYKLSEQLPARQVAWWQRWFQAPARNGVAAPTRRRAPARGLAVGLSLALGLLLLISGVFYTTGTLASHHGQSTVSSTSNAAALLSAFLRSDARLRGLSFTAVNQAHSIDTGTVDLQQVYVDANNVVLAYTFEGKLGTNAFSAVKAWSSPTITLPDQQKLQASFAVLHQQGNLVAVVAFYDGSIIQGGSRELPLKISIPTDKTTEEFNPTVHFSAGKAVQVNQSATSHGIAVTLERVVITPSSTRIYYTVPGQRVPLDWQVSVAGKTYHTSEGYYGGPEDYANIWSSEISVPGHLKYVDGPIPSGTWTVKALLLGSPQDNWQFTLNVK